MIETARSKSWQCTLTVALLCAFASWIGTPSAVAGPITIVRVAGELDPAPFGGHFVSGFGIPAIAADRVAFTGFQEIPGFDPQRAAYSYSSGLLQRIAAVGDPAPGGSIYTDFSANAPSVDSGRVGFIAATSAGQGIFLADNGTLQLLVQQGWPVPALGGTFSALYSPSLSGDNFVFAADGSTVPVGHAGIFTGGSGQLTAIALQGDPMPGGGQFSDFDIAPAISGSSIAFLGSGGVFLAANGILSVVASSVTPAPGGAGQFNGFADVTIDGGRIAFRGDTSSGQQGIYTADGATISVIAQRGDPVPGILDSFTDFGQASLSKGNVAFYGAAGTGQGIFLVVGEVLTRVVGTGDILDGRTVASVVFGSEGLSGDQLAFGVTFSDESQAIYLADVSALTTAVPEPASLILFAVGCTSLFAWNGWRRHVRTT